MYKDRNVLDISWFRISIFLVLLLLGFVLLTGVAASDSWSEFQSNDFNTGFLDTDPLDPGDFPTPVEQEWSTDIGGKVRASPITKGGVLYVGSTNGHFYAIQKSSGKIIWDKYVGSGIDEAALVTDEYIYVGTNDGNLYQLDRMSGNTRWRFETSHEVNTPIKRFCLFNCAVFFGTLNAEGPNLYAVVDNTGEELWNQSLSGSVTGLAVNHEETSLYASSAGHGFELSSIHTVFGDFEWRFNAGNSVVSEPTVIDGRAGTGFIGNDTVFIGTFDEHRQDKFYAVDSGSGRELWSINTDSMISSAAFSFPFMYVEGTDTSGSLSIFYKDTIRTIDPFTGETYWYKRPVLGSSASSPATVGGDLYLTKSGDLHVYDGSSGEKMYSFGLGGADGALFSSPAVVDGKLFVGTETGEMVAIDDREPVPAEFKLNVPSGNVVRGHDLLPVEVSNIGDFEDSQTVELYIDGGLVDTEFVSLGPRETKELEMEWTTTEEDIGEEFDVVVKSNDDVVSKSIGVEPQPELIEEVDYPVVQQPGRDAEIKVQSRAGTDVTMYYSVDGGIENSVEMRQINFSYLVGDIPGQPSGSRVDVRLEAEEGFLPASLGVQSSGDSSMEGGNVSLPDMSVIVETENGTEEVELFDRSSGSDSSKGGSVSLAPQSLGGISVQSHEPITDVERFRYYVVDNDDKCIACTD